MWERSKRSGPRQCAIVSPYLASTITTPWANSAGGKLMIYFLLYQENRIRHFMQVVSIGDNLHLM